MPRKWSPHDRREAAAHCIPEPIVIRIRQMNKEGTMKTRKLGWQGILAGVALCALLTVFIGGKAADAQVTGTQQITKVATMNDIYQATAEMEVRLARMEKKIDALSEQSDLIFKMVKKMYKHAGIE
jgi:hypothetical protein